MLAVVSDPKVKYFWSFIYAVNLKFYSPNIVVDLMLNVYPVQIKSRHNLCIILWKPKVSKTIKARVSLTGWNMIASNFSTTCYMMLLEEENAWELRQQNDTTILDNQVHDIHIICGDRKVWPAKLNCLFDPELCNGIRCFRYFWPLNEHRILNFKFQQRNIRRGTFKKPSSSCWLISDLCISMSRGVWVVILFDHLILDIEYR